jgi:hypothetical protein
MLSHAQTGRSRVISYRLQDVGIYLEKNHVLIS